MTPAEVENIARKVADEVAGRLPCKEHTQKINSNYSILHDGLKDKVELIDKKIDTVIQHREDEKRDRDSGRKTFWRAFAIGTIGPVIVFIITYLISRVF